MLSDFLDHSRARPLSQAKHSKKNPIEGVWITSRSGIQKEITAAAHDLLLPERDDDDIIWWSWEGKITGFSDW